ncbi:MAG: peptidase M14 [Leadbetterella sp.]|nr:peptidase M14 [Leadbetterella sp.]
MSRLIDFHDSFKEKTLNTRRFKHGDVLRLMAGCGFGNQSVGRSFEGRDIRKITAGSGKKKILLWSQMHGDEATATMAIFDILNFLRSEDRQFNGIRQAILSELELHFVPMLNPDGAERFQRRTAQEIDMNRDALALQCPESRILKSLVLELRPEFSFNLHDQAIYYAVGDTPVQTTIAFLATAADPEREWTPGRIRSMQVICKMHEELQPIIPGRIARFSDEFEPRAFGDNIQKWGSSLILVESGAYPGDPEKQYIRALNFHIILEALYAIAQETYTGYRLEEYEAIPPNNRAFFDLKITNLTVPDPKGDYTVDLGILRTEKNTRGAKNFTHRSVIEDVGDLSVFHGIQVFDAKGGKFRPVEDFPAWREKYKAAPGKLQIGEKATFVIDHGRTQTLVLNGKIV